MIIERGTCTMCILDHPKPLKMGSFGIHMPMAMRLMVLHTQTQRAVVTKILRVSMMYLYLQCTQGVPNVSETYHDIPDSL